MEEEGEATGGGDGEELQPEFDRDSGPYLKMIEHAEKAFDQWHKTCDNLAKEFANLKRLASSRTDREFQMFYANLEVVKPSIYSRAPQPVVVPRFKDRKPVPRKASEMLERALVTSFDVEHVHETMKRVRDDLALFGRGVIWARYETYEKGEELKECVRYEWVHRKDFLHEPARIWSEVGWVCRGTWLTKEQGQKRFGEAWGDDITYEEAKDTASEYNVEKKARVWEMWNKTKDMVIWLHPNSKQVLDINAPHLSLDGFFPCPRPALATVEDDSLVPVPDGCFYKDQLEEINELTARISSLSEALRLVVIYPAGAEGVGEAVEAAIAQTDNRRTWVPVAGLGNLAMQTGGKLQDAIWEMPVDKVAATITQLIALRRELISDVYQISGVSDIMRGETDASETLGAQQLKSQYGSIRIKDRQNEMVRLCDAILNLAGEIMSENFAPQTMISLSQTDLPKQADVLAQHQQAMMQEIMAAVQQVEQGMAQGQPPPNPQQIEQAKQAIVLKHQKEIAEVVTVEKVFELLKAERIRPYILQIATDSTIQPDENAEKAARSEFAMAFAQMSGALAPLMQAAPKEAAPLSGAMLKFVLAPFRAGREMEQVIEEFVDNMTEKASQPPPPNPEAEAMMKTAELEGKKLEADVAAKMADAEDRKAERDAKLAQAAKAQEAEGMKANQDAMRQAEEAERKRQDEMVKRQQAMEDRALKRQDEDRKAAEAARKAEHDAMMRNIDLMMARIAMDTERLKIISMAEQADEAKREKQEKEAQFEAKEFEREGRETAFRSDGEAKSSKRDEAMNAVLASLSQGLETVAQAQQALAESMSRPKTIKFNSEGRPVGIQ
jgi:hypothetical protein